jgi:hypothetical protein
MIRFLLEFESLSLSRSDFESEKNATSVPEISAESSKRKSKAITPVITDQSILDNKNILVGSGSKEK